MSITVFGEEAPANNKTVVVSYNVVSETSDHRDEAMSVIDIVQSKFEARRAEFGMPEPIIVSFPYGFGESYTMRIIYGISDERNVSHFHSSLIEPIWVGSFDYAVSEAASKFVAKETPYVFVYSRGSWVEVNVQ